MLFWHDAALEASTQAVSEKKLKEEIHLKTLIVEASARSELTDVLQKAFAGLSDLLDPLNTKTPPKVQAVPMVSLRLPDKPKTKRGRPPKEKHGDLKRNVTIEDLDKWATQRAAREQTAEEKEGRKAKHMKQRNCLKCQKSFKSYGVQNRMCQLCKNYVDRVLCMPTNWV